MFLLHWLLGNGVGQGITDSLILVPAAWLWSRTKYWPLRAVHARLDRLHASHVELHRKLDNHASAIEALHQRVTGRGGDSAPTPTARRARASGPRTPRRNP